MDDSRKAKHITLAAASGKGPPPAGNLAIPVFSSNAVAVELYEPLEVDDQKPHTRDEVYIVARGQGYFWDGEKRYEVSEGSFIFVPAGLQHRFEDFSKDLSVWVFFYGPEGGDAA